MSWRWARTRAFWLAASWLVLAVAGSVGLAHLMPHLPFRYDAVWWCGRCDDGVAARDPPRTRAEAQALMGYLHPGDKKLHYSDASHRWVAPSDADQPAWDARLRAHMAAHARGDPPRGAPRRLGE